MMSRCTFFARFRCVFVTWCEGLATLGCLTARVKSKRLLSLKRRLASSVDEMRNAFLSRTILGLWFQGRRANFWNKGYRFLFSFSFALTSQTVLATGTGCSYSFIADLRRKVIPWRMAMRVCVSLTIVFFFASRRAWTRSFPSLFLPVNKFCEAGSHAQFLVRRLLNIRERERERERARKKRERNEQEGWTFCHGEDRRWHQREWERKKNQRRENHSRIPNQSVFPFVCSILIIFQISFFPTERADRIVVVCTADLWELFPHYVLYRSKQRLEPLELVNYPPLLHPRIKRLLID